ncbi:hypothetical protein [Arthrobacter sp. H5]|uniref:hypothetical protein n=1 Tax=Arthrobacter sp. H5 TaxID=1267973 RepID=UPI0004AFA799|nr:hypothetical protein [Arthrobacter sp. H5]
MSEQGNEDDAAEESSLEREPNEPGENSASGTEAGGYGGPGPENETAEKADDGR